MIYDAYGTPINPEKLPDGIDVFFQIPLFDGFNTWDTKSAKHAAVCHELGEFPQSGRMFWGMLSDTRVVDGLEKRGLALRGMKVAIRPGKGQRAKTLAKKYAAVRDRMLRPEVVSELLDQAIMMGQGIAQPCWNYDERGPDNPAAKKTAGKWFVPRVETWDPTLARWIPGPWLPYWQTSTPQPWQTVQGQLTVLTRGSERQDYSLQVPVIPGSGQWLLFKLAGDRRPWMHGKIRSIWRPWIAALLALLGDVRFNDIHGLPIRAVKVPMGMRKTPETQKFFKDVENLGQSASFLMPQGTNGQFGVGLEFVEAKSESWKSFIATLEWTGKEITIALTGGTQNTEATGGNYKGAEEQREIRHEVKAATALAWALMETEQLAEPFAEINGYDREEAPIIEFDTAPPAANAAEAKAIQERSKAMTESIRAWWEARRAGGRVGLDKWLENDGLTPPDGMTFQDPPPPAPGPPSVFPGAQKGDAAAGLPGASGGTVPADKGAPTEEAA